MSILSELSSCEHINTTRCAKVYEKNNTYTVMDDRERSPAPAVADVLKTMCVCVRVCVCECVCVCVCYQHNKVLQRCTRKTHAIHAHLCRAPVPCSIAALKHNLIKASCAYLSVWRSRAHPFLKRYAHPHSNPCVVCFHLCPHAKAELRPFQGTPIHTLINVVFTACTVFLYYFFIPAQYPASWPQRAFGQRFGLGAV